MYQFEVIRVIDEYNRVFNPLKTFGSPEEVTGFVQQIDGAFDVVVNVSKSGDGHIEEFNGANWVENGEATYKKLIDLQV